MVWKSTTKLGCGVAVCDNIFPDKGPATYHVCLYDPVGNVIGEEAYVSFVRDSGVHSETLTSHPRVVKTSPLITEHVARGSRDKFPSPCVSARACRTMAFSGQEPVLHVYLSPLPRVWRRRLTYTTVPRRSHGHLLARSGLSLYLSLYPVAVCCCLRSSRPTCCPSLGSRFAVPCTPQSMQILCIVTIIL